MNKCIHYMIVFGPLFCCVGCMSPAVYKNWENQLDEEVTFSQIIQDPEKHKGKLVYLGGVIINTTNTTTGTQIEVLQRPLGSDHKPQETDQSEGRFLVMYPRFLDSMVYVPNRHIVVAGEIGGARLKPLGDTEYQYPVIEAKEIQLLEKKSSRVQPSFGIGVGIGL